MQKKKLVSLFSGCGGMDLGFEGDFLVEKNSINFSLHSDWVSKPVDEKWVRLKPTFFETHFANDIRLDAKTAWEAYFSKRNKPSGIYRIESIVDIVKKTKNYELNLLPKDVDIVTGGFPCQDFSIAGKRRGFSSHVDHGGNRLHFDEPSIENRGQLYIWMREVIQITKPKIFIAENVKGLVNLSDVKDVIQNDFSSGSNHEYLVISPRVLNSGNYGVPQSRERVFFIGFLKSALRPEALSELSSINISPNYDPYPIMTHHLNNNEKGRKTISFVPSKKYLEDLPEPHLSMDPSQQQYSRAKFMGKHCQGQTEVNLNGLAPTIRSEHHGNIEFRRLSLQNGGRKIEELDAGFIERRLTVRECARLQTFPDDYQFIINNKDSSKRVSGSSAYKIIGNAVPPLLAYNIAKNLEKKWDLYFYSDHYE